MKKAYLTVLALFLAISSFATLGPITGTGNVCMGLTTALNNATPGGAWMSGNPSIASIGSGSGVVTGLLPGTATIIYTVGAGSVSTIVTVNANPAIHSVSGGGAYCAGTGGSILVIGREGKENLQ
jgi:hypothetical protein